MIEREISFDLPVPWQEKRFDTPRIGKINFLVGPNGSGKSKFAVALHGHLGDARILDTDRLSGMEQASGLWPIFGDHFANGLAKNRFAEFKSAGQKGSGIDTLVLLEERMDLRIQVEATISHLFDRKIILEWDSGHLVAKAVLGGTGDSYRLDRDECHGIKELLVLLTHLYNDKYPYLIIDEPELNLHPQYQAFLMEEVRKLAGDPSVDSTKKVFFLVTHSPFILDFRSIDDVKSVISFDLEYSVPTHLFRLEKESTKRLSSLVPRLNVHHKQLFFSDNPIFVEGILDARLVSAMQEARGVSIAAAGSCIIDAGGSEEVNRYLELAQAFGKKAYFLYDLDSLFGGSLRSCVAGDSSVQGFLLKAGVGNDFAKYCGELDRRLTKLIDQLLGSGAKTGELSLLLKFLLSLGSKDQWKKDDWRKARVAVLTAISRDRAGVEEIISRQDIGDIDGRLAQVVAALKEKNILLLPGGTLERYLPEYAGDHYELSDAAKRKAVEDEIEVMSKGMTTQEMAARYGGLYEAASSLPSKPPVDLDRVLGDYLAQYIHDLQGAVISNPEWSLAEVQLHLNTLHTAARDVFSVGKLTRSKEKEKEFEAEVTIAEMFGGKRRCVRVSQNTIAGMRDFVIDCLVDTASTAS